MQIVRVLVILLVLLLLEGLEVAAAPMVILEAVEVEEAIPEVGVVITALMVEMEVVEALITLGQIRITNAADWEIMTMEKLLSSFFHSVPVRMVLQLPELTAIQII